MSERFGRYTLLKKLGAGGMGEVFLAQPIGSESTDHFVVVKTLLPLLAQNEKLVEMFLEEAKFASQLEHPNICRVLDVGLTDGILFMALEFIRGVDLEGLQRKAASTGTSIPVPMAVRIIADAARGLDHAHKLTDENGRLLGLVHRDVSPHNLLVSFDGKVKVIDFGLAKTVGLAHHSHGGTLKGKFAYMSPEMVKDERIDLRVDVFALGIVLHELLSGQRLFRKDSDVATLAAIIQCEVPRLSEINPSVPPALDEIVFKALAKERPRRYQSAAELTDALDVFSETYGGNKSVDLGKWMRTQYHQELREQAAKGILHDAPKGPVMAARSHSSEIGIASQVIARQDAIAHPAEPEPAPLVIDETVPFNSRPAQADALTERAILDENGIPVLVRNVQLAPRPVATTSPVLTHVARPPQRTLDSLPSLSTHVTVVPGNDPEVTIAQSSESRFDTLRREALELSQSYPGVENRPSTAKPAPYVEIKHHAGRQVFAYPPLEPTSIQHAKTVALAPAYYSQPPAPVDSGHAPTQSLWIGIGIGLAVAVIVGAALLLALA